MVCVYVLAQNGRVLENQASLLEKKTTRCYLASLLEKKKTRVLILLCVVCVYVRPSAEQTSIRKSSLASRVTANVVFLVRQ